MPYFLAVAEKALIFWSVISILETPVFMLHKLPEGLLAVPELRIILVLFHIRQHLFHGLLQELGGHFTGLHTKRKGFLRDFFLQGVHLRSPLPYRSWLTRDV